MFTHVIIRILNIYLSLLNVTREDMIGKEQKFLSQEVFILHQPEKLDSNEKYLSIYYPCFNFNHTIIV